MPTQFITNEGRRLTDEIANVMPSCRALHFLVGYFYFSGFEQIYRNISDKHIRILVGLDVERDIAGRVREFEALQAANHSRNQIRVNYYKSLVSVFNDTGYFDPTERQEAFRLFLEKIKNGSLEIRKTIKPNHAKLYIFENKQELAQNGSYPGTIITGSSNLSRSGLETNFEINKDFRDAAHYDEALKIFQNLWKDENSVPLADVNIRDQFLENVAKRIWLDQLPAPYLLYIRVLEEYFRVEKRAAVRLPADITDGEYLNLKYQSDAIRRALEVIRRHGGVILADVVGLGKSIIASAVARNLDAKTIVIAPPHLVEQWDDYRFAFGYNALVYSRGRIADALKENEGLQGGLIVIDEAHRYRNELTQDYGHLHRLCQGNKVMLLTATPFNNTPADVFSMIKLFQIPMHSTLQAVQNLSFQFRNLILEYKDIRRAKKAGDQPPEVIEGRIRKVAQQIRDIMFPLVIRRSRLDLDAIDEYKQDLRTQKISFPKVNPPSAQTYELGALTELYRETLADISPEDDQKGFIGARYMPISYLKNIQAYRDKITKDLGLPDENLLRETQINLAKFMKRLLVRRFESSIEAFQKTLESMIISMEKAKAYYEKLGKVPIYKKGALPEVEDLEAVLGEELDEEIREKMLEKELEEYREKGLQLIDRGELRVQYFKDLEDDIALLRKVQKRWHNRKNTEDPKLNHFREIVSAWIKKEPARKIVVFTEFADTAAYLWNNLRGDLRVFKYSASDASREAKRTIRENFDAGAEVQKNEFDILVATDAISEGFNLHRAGIIFNYDIPYNPTRVIQRVGRINRINKKMFDELFIYNYFPTATGEKETHIKSISTLKIAMVHALFGEDTKFLTKDEELQTWMVGRFKKDMLAQEEVSPETPYENIIRKLRVSNPELIQKALAVPKRVRIARSVTKSDSGVLIFARKGEDYAFRFGGSGREIISPGVADAFGLFEAASDEVAKPVSKGFSKIYDDIVLKLFESPSQVELDRGKSETINKIRKLTEKWPAHRDYLEDLLRVVEKLDSLPAGYAKAIRAIDFEEKDVRDLIVEIPPAYLADMITRDQEIEDSPEVLILSEELP